MIQITCESAQDILSDIQRHLTYGKMSHLDDAMGKLQAAIDAPEQEPLEFLLDGARVKLNFNKVGNMTSLQNMHHELQGRWVSFVGAENDKHLRAAPPAPKAPEPLLQQIAEFGELQNKAPQARELTDDDIRAVYKKLWPGGLSITPFDIEFANAVLAARSAS